MFSPLVISSCYFLLCFPIVRSYCFFLLFSPVVFSCCFFLLFFTNVFYYRFHTFPLALRRVTVCVLTALPPRWLVPTCQIKSSASGRTGWSLQLRTFMAVHSTPSLKQKSFHREVTALYMLWRHNLVDRQFSTLCIQFITPACKTSQVTMDVQPLYTPSPIWGVYYRGWDNTQK